MLGGVAGQPQRLARRARPAPASAPSAPAPAPIASAMSRSTSSPAAVDVDRPRHPLDLPRRQPQRLAEVAHRAARAVGGEGGDQRRALGAVALVDPRDQLLADVAREVEVDVGHLGHLLVQEAAREELVLHRIDVREPGQVADDRADARAPPPPGRQQPPRRIRPPHLDRHLARQLEQVAMQQEEAREPQLADHRQLLLQPPLGLGALGESRVALGQPPRQISASLPSALAVLGPRIAVAELPREVEAQPLGQPHGLRDRLRVVGERAPPSPAARASTEVGLPRRAASVSPASSPAAPRRAHPGAPPASGSCECDVPGGHRRARRAAPRATPSHRFRARRGARTAAAARSGSGPGPKAAAAAAPVFGPGRLAPLPAPGDGPVAGASRETDRAPP